MRNMFSTTLNEFRNLFNPADINKLLTMTTESSVLHSHAYWVYQLKGVHKGRGEVGKEEGKRGQEEGWRKGHLESTTPKFNFPVLICWFIAGSLHATDNCPLPTAHVLCTSESWTSKKGKRKRKKNWSVRTVDSRYVTLVIPMCWPYQNMLFPVPTGHAHPKLD